MIDAFALFRKEFDAAMLKLAASIVADVNTARHSVDVRLTDLEEGADATTGAIQDALKRLKAAETAIAVLQGTKPEEPDPDPDPDPEPEPTQPSGYILYSKSRIMSRPTSGKPWERLLARAKGSWAKPDLGDNNAQGDADVVAGAVVAVRLNDAAMREKVIAQLKLAPASRLTRTLELGRGLLGYVVAANLIGYADKAFVDWVHAMVTRKFGDGDRWGSFDTILITALAFNSNWATQCRRSVVGAAMYLMQVGTDAQKADGKKWLADAVEAHKRDIGVPGNYPTLPPLTTSPTGWSGDADPVVGINPEGTSKIIGGKRIDLNGVRPADWLRSKGPDGREDREAKYWPTNPVTYHWEGIGPQAVLAMILHEHGLVKFSDANNAIVRALNALYGRVPNDPPFYNPASGDDRSIPWIVNHYARENFPTEPDEMPDKAGIGWMDWYLG